MTITKQLIALVPLSLLLVGLVGYNFMSADWTNPTAVAPAENVSAPINIGSVYQAKLGDLGAVRMRAGEYCDASGLICFDAVDVVGGSTTTGSTLGYSTSLTYSGTAAADTNIPATASCALTGMNTGGCDSGVSCGISVSGDSWQVDQRQYGDCDRGSSCTYTCIGLKDPITYTYSWAVSNWTACHASQTCTTNGSQSRTASCMRSDGTQAPESYCTSPKPSPLSQSCVAQSRGSDC